MSFFGDCAAVPLCPTSVLPQECIAPGNRTRAQARLWQVTTSPLLIFNLKHSNSLFLHVLSEFPYSPIVLRNV